MPYIILQNIQYSKKSLPNIVSSLILSMTSAKTFCNHSKFKITFDWIFDLIFDSKVVWICSSCDSKFTVSCVLNFAWISFCLKFSFAFACGFVFSWIFNFTFSCGFDFYWIFDLACSWGSSVSSPFSHNTHKH